MRREDIISCWHAYGKEICFLSSLTNGRRHSQPLTVLNPTYILSVSMVNMERCMMDHLLESLWDYPATIRAVSDKQWYKKACTEVYWHLWSLIICLHSSISIFVKGERGDWIAVIVSTFASSSFWFLSVKGGKSHRAWLPQPLQPRAIAFRWSGEPVARGPGVSAQSREYSAHFLLCRSDW